MLLEFEQVRISVKTVTKSRRQKRGGNVLKNDLVVNARIIEKLAVESLRMMTQIEKECLEECKELPQGKLHAAKRGNGVSYYKRNRKDEKTGEYIPKKNFEEAKKLAQREYDEKLLKTIKSMKFHLNCILHMEDKLYVRSITESKIQLVEKKVLSDEEYIEDWEQQKYYGKSSDEIMTEYFTDKGEHVRSKSECLIANALYRMNIPYKYEQECKVEGYNDYHPDFTCINVRNRHQIIWEHLGMMTDAGYVEKQVRKIKKLITSGYKLGEDFIITMETQLEPLSTKVIEQMISDYLL